MKSKWDLICYIVQITVGTLATIAFIVLSVSSENITKWIITLLLGIVCVIAGTIGIINYKKQKHH